jgi:hypothetical protein
MEIAVKMAEMSSEGCGRRGGGGADGSAGDSPAAGIMGGAPSLSPLPSWIHGSPLLWRWDPWGRRKRGCKFVGGGVPHELGFLPLYSFSDFRLLLLGRTRSGLTRPSGLGIR